MLVIDIALDRRETKNERVQHLSIKIFVAGFMTAFTVFVIVVVVFFRPPHFWPIDTFIEGNEIPKIIVADCNLDVRNIIVVAVCVCAHAFMICVIKLILK